MNSRLWAARARPSGYGIDQFLQTGEKLGAERFAEIGKDGSSLPNAPMHSPCVSANRSRLMAPRLASAAAISHSGHHHAEMPAMLAIHDLIEFFNGLRVELDRIPVARGAHDGLAPQFVQLQYKIGFFVDKHVWPPFPRAVHDAHVGRCYEDDQLRSHSASGIALTAKSTTDASVPAQERSMLTVK